MSDSNGSTNGATPPSRILSLETMQSQRQKARANAQNVTVGELREYVVDEMVKVSDHYMGQIPQLVGHMISAALQAYDQAKREAFEKAIAPLSRDGLAPEVCDILDTMREVFGLPLVAQALALHEEQPKESAPIEATPDAPAA